METDEDDKGNTGDPRDRTIGTMLQAQHRQERKIILQEAALNRIEQWCRAYPVDVFPPLTDEQLRTANTVLSFADISIGALHAQWARHILSGIADIIATAKQE